MWRAQNGGRQAAYEDFYSHIPCGMWRTYSYTWVWGKNFYSHIPCGMWQHLVSCFPRSKYFYSHIPCGMWLYIYYQNSIFWQFLLTHPVWDVTISLHISSSIYVYFYSHIPCGMWRICWWTYYRYYRFLLTHPVWDVTYRFSIINRKNRISTHTSRVGCDHILPSQAFRLQISTHTSRVGCDRYI